MIDKAQKGVLVLTAIAIMCTGIGAIWGWPWGLFWFGLMLWLSL